MLEDKIFSDFKDAMKNNDAIKKSTLNFLRSQLKNVSIESKKEKLEDEEVVAIIRKQVKQRLDSIEKFKAGERVDLAEKEEKEVEILKYYLPKEMSSEELGKIVDDVITETQATGMKEMGKVMKEVVQK